MSEAKTLNSAIKGSNNTTDVTEFEKECAQEILTECNAGNYVQASNLLTKIRQGRPHDTKVLMNQAVIEYFMSGLKKTDAFMKELKTIIEKVKSKGEKKSGGPEDVELSVSRLNQALVFFHRHQYRAAVNILEEIYTSLEPMEESVGIGMCVLLVECLLCLHQPSKALSILAHTEQTFLPQPLPPHNPTNAKEPIAEKDIGKDMSSAATSIMAASRPMDMEDNIELRCSAGQEQLRSRLQLLRVRALLMIRLLRIAKKEFKAVVTQAVNSQSQLNVTLVMVRSQYDFLKGNHHKAIKILNQCASVSPLAETFGPELHISYYNNLGVIHMSLGKSTMALLYFQKALSQLRENTAKEKNSPPIYSLSSSSLGAELCYNAGLCLLYLGNPDRAFEFFVQVLLTFPSNPRLWLRVAECCVVVHQQKVTSSSPCSSKQELRQHLLGGGIPTQAKLITLPNKFGSMDKELPDLQSTSDSAFPVPTLEFARLCLRNCLSVLPENPSTSTLTDEQEASGVLPEMLPCPPTPPLRGIQCVNVRVNCLALSCFVALCLGDFHLALKQANLIINMMPKAAPVYRLMAHLYAGEALVLLSRSSEAMSHFDPRQLAELSTNTTTNNDNNNAANCNNNNSNNSNNNTCSLANVGNSNNGCQTQPTQSTLCFVLRYNLCVALAIRGQHDKAVAVAEELWQQDVQSNFEVQLLIITLYLHLKLGNQKEVREILKKHLL